MKKILFASSEAVPFIKTGGLADVVGSLPKYFDRKQFDVRVIAKICVYRSKAESKDEAGGGFYCQTWLEESVCKDFKGKSRRHTILFCGE